jgi:hypothetical protein
MILRRIPEFSFAAIPSHALLFIMAVILFIAVKIVVGLTQLRRSH